MRYLNSCLFLLLSYLCISSALAGDYINTYSFEKPSSSADAGQGSIIAKSNSTKNNGDCGRGAKVYVTSGSCTDSHNSPQGNTGGYTTSNCSSYTATSTIQMNATPTQACQIFFEARSNHTHGLAWESHIVTRSSTHTIKINQYLEWEGALPSNNFVGPTGTIQAISRYKQNPSATVTGRNTITYTSSDVNICHFGGSVSTSSAGAVTFTVVGSTSGVKICEITASEAGDSNFVAASSVHTFTISDADGDGVTDVDETINGTDPDVVETSEKSKLSITPRYYLFAQEEVNAGSCESTSTPVNYVIKNTDTSAHQLTTAPTILGPNSGEFRLVAGANNCGSTITLNPGQSCDFDVVFCPTSNGNKAAYLEVGTNVEFGTPTKTRKVTSALFNYEADEDAAKRRVPPLLTNVAISPAPGGTPASPVLTQNTTYGFTLDVQGYSLDYKVQAIIFSCDASQQARCGKYWYENSPTPTAWLDASGPVTGDIVYSNIDAGKFSYTFDYTPTASDVGKIMVMRVYVVSQEDINAQQGSISLLAPGNLLLPAYEYGQGGRRLQFTVQ